MFFNKKICCDRLQGLYFVESNMASNFRVIALSDKFIEESKRRGINQEKELRFILTNGYNGKLSSEVTQKLFIAHCPFCGKELKKIFCEDQINEINHDW